MYQVHPRIDISTLGEKACIRKGMCLIDVKYSPEGGVKRKNLYNRKKHSIQKISNGLVFNPNCGINAFLFIINYRERKMPKACEVCGKSPVFGQSLSHSHKASKKKWKPNLQKVKAQTPGGTRRIWVCTRCLRSGKVTKAA